MSTRPDLLALIAAALPSGQSGAITAAGLRQLLGALLAELAFAGEIALKADLINGTIPVQQIPVLDASQIGSGMIDPARIPLLLSQTPVVSSGGLAALTTGQQAQINAGTTVATTDGKRYVYTGSGSKTLAASYIVLSDTSQDWSTIANRPSSFPTSAANIGDASTDSRSLIQAADFGAIRALLGLVIGTHVQGYSATLAALAGLSTTAVGRSLLVIADQAAGRAVLGAVSAAEVTAAIAQVVGAAPSTLDTLAEIQAAINSDPNFATTVMSALALKAALASPTFTGTPAGPTAAQGTNTTQLATCAFVIAEIVARALAKAAGTDLRTLTDDAKFLTAKSVADATKGTAIGSITGAVALNFVTNGPNQVATAAGTITLGQHTLPASATDSWMPVSLEVVQDATGSRGLAANMTYNTFPGGSVYTLSTAAGARDVLYGQARLIGGVALVQWTGFSKDVR